MLVGAPPVQLRFAAHFRPAVGHTCGECRGGLLMNHSKAGDVHAAARGDRPEDAAAAVPSLKRSLLVGASGFCIASLCVLATVAFAERWM